MSSKRAALWGAISCALLMGCAAQESTRLKGTTPAAAEPSREKEVASLKAQLAERDRKLSTLENRLSLIEAEQRQHRLALESAQEAPAGIHETVRIGGNEGASREPPISFSEQPPPERTRAPKHENRPLLRLYEQHSNAYESSSNEGDPLMPVPTVNERLPMFVPAPIGSGPRPAPVDPNEHYRQAIDLVRQRNFDDALLALNDFLVRYPDDARAPRVLFWRGEVLFAQRDFEHALSAFETSLAKDPAGEKAADAWLRISRCHTRLGAPERARAARERLKSQFPNSDAARLAAQEDA